MNNENKHSESDRPLIGQKMIPGQDGNIFNLVRIVVRTLKKNGHLTDVSEMIECVFIGKSYEKAFFY